MPGTKDYHEFRFSIVRIAINVSNVTSPRIVFVAVEVFGCLFVKTLSIIFTIVSSEGALIAITPYDYSQQHPLFEHTPVPDNNLNINAMMTLVTMITIKTEITKTKSAASVA